MQGTYDGLELPSTTPTCATLTLQPACQHQQLHLSHHRLQLGDEVGELHEVAVDLELWQSA